MSQKCFEENKFEKMFIFPDGFFIKSPNKIEFEQNIEIITNTEIIKKAEFYRKPEKGEPLCINEDNCAGKNRKMAGYILVGLDESELKVGKGKCLLCRELKIVGKIGSNGKMIDLFVD